MLGVLAINHLRSTGHANHNIIIMKLKSIIAILVACVAVQCYAQSGDTQTPQSGDAQQNTAPKHSKKQNAQEKKDIKQDKKDIKEDKKEVKHDKKALHHDTK